MASSSSSGLTFKLHPLGAAAAASPPPPPPRVFGCVIGVQRGRTVEIFNSFELLYDPSTHSLDRSFLEKKQELYKKVFPNFYILGWYSTGSDAQDQICIFIKLDVGMDLTERVNFAICATKRFDNLGEDERQA
ncbi:COP9 signalosome complex subunit 6a [Vitis vinifera]|uniref:COP9 signalosome complex subunit 6a n=1 Tax=Vitis vinifera TaxID=29760 RepID=A0A438CCT0_VITVI|nr:COP9 signalosome complex subunit 6a [Vitis vinifera]